MLEPFIETYHVYEVPLYQKEGLTFYTRHTDLFAHLSIFYSFILFFYAITSKALEKKKEKDALSSVFERMDERVEC